MGGRLRLAVVVGVVTAGLALPASALAANPWAVVSGTGVLVRGHNATAASALGTGTYQVTFSTNQTGCAYEATPGDTGAGAVSGPVVATVASRAGNANALFIQTFDQTTGALVNAPVHVVSYCGAKANFAVVDSTGVRARSSHVVSSQRLSTGAYEVIFDHRVKNCAYNATIGTTGTGSVGSPGSITVAGRAGNQNGVFVLIVSRTGASLDSSFHLAITCGLKKIWAVLDSGGTKARGANVVSTAKLSGANGGTYEVIFNRNVSVCAYNATVGTTTFGGSVSTPVAVTSATRAGNANGVFVFIHHDNGSTIDEPFHLSVYC
jgi:hypothetical protein